MTNLNTASKGTVLCCLVLCLGCANTRLEEIYLPIPTSVESPQQKADLTKYGFHDPKWREITYTGVVAKSSAPVEGAIVSIFEGTQRIRSTVTDSEGRFELTCPVFGIQVTKKSGEMEWEPDLYYSIVSQGPEGGFEKRRLHELPLGEPIRLRLRPVMPPA